MVNIKRFDKETAGPGHNGTILASRLLPDGMEAPFDATWGYLENDSEMEAHAHPTEEIYVVIKGSGVVVVGEEKANVGPGDVIEIPPDIDHTMICEDGGPLLWAALWWG